MQIMQLPTKKARIAAIREKLATDPRWAQRGLMAVYRNQTQDEKAGHTTVEQNGVGFTSFDAELLTSLARQLDGLAGRPLSYRQMQLLMLKMPKYATQLHNIAKGTQQ